MTRVRQTSRETGSGDPSGLVAAPLTHHLWPVLWDGHTSLSNEDDDVLLVSFFNIFMHLFGCVES